MKTFLLLVFLFFQMCTNQVFSQTNSSFTDTAKIYLEQPFLYVDGKPVSIIRSQIDSLTLINQLRRFDDVKRLRMDLDFVSKRTSAAGVLMTGSFVLSFANYLYLINAKENYNINLGKVLTISSLTLTITSSITLASSHWSRNKRYRTYFLGKNYVY